jgi:hypothetical protein
MHVRLQTWFPFTLQICMNGREWLVQQLQRTGAAFTRVDNCVTHVADVVRAQRLLDQLTTRCWARRLRSARRARQSAGSVRQPSVAAPVLLESARERVRH